MPLPPAAGFAQNNTYMFFILHCRKNEGSINQSLISTTVVIKIDHIIIQFFKVKLSKSSIPDNVK